MTEQLERLKALLTDAGYEFTVSGYEGTWTLSVDVSIGEAELPEELRPFAWAADQVERALWKGTDKRTYVGAAFELAFQDYCSVSLFRDPENVALEETLKDIKTLEEFDAYQEKRRAIWARVSQREDIVRLQAMLDTLL